PPKPRPFLLLVESGLPPCPNAPPTDDRGTRVIIRGECRSVKAVVQFMNLNLTENILPKWQVRVPVLGKTAVLRNIDLRTPKDIVLYVMHYVDGTNTPGDTVLLRKADREDRPYMVISLESPDRGEHPLKAYFHFLPRMKYVPLPWSYRYSTYVSSGLGVASSAIAVAAASYLHFVWIQSPAGHRVRILSVFFLFRYLGESIILESLGRWEFIALVIIQGVGVLWHTIFTIIFGVTLRKLNDEEKKKKRTMKF
ncbi:unnamed protein product, partial [Nesidiocoris tenuis]